jgi:CBS domain-containing protein
MSKPVVTCNPDTPLIDLTLLMQEKHVRHVPALEKGRLVGIICSSDLAWYGIPVVLKRT